MAQLFVSHSSADNEFAEKLREALAGLGYESVFLDFDAQDGLVPGQAWREQLFTNIDASDALVLITTPASNASKWCHSELALARWLRKPLLCLLLDGSDPHELTADLQGLKVSSAGLEPDQLKAALEALGLEQTTRWDASRSPFPGLQAFDESYAAVFFGRDRQIEQLRQLVDPPSRSRDGAVIPVLGPSGSGKSSLVRAGLVPALRPSPDWVISEPWTPSDVPLAEMALALSQAAKQQGADLDADACADLLRTPGGMADYLRTLREAGTLGADTKVLVVMDQAEELVTMTPETERRAFLEALTASCAAPSPLRVVMTARTDMWDSVAAETARFATSVAPTVLHVTPLGRSDLAEIISEPAKRSHLTLEEGLVQRLVEDTDTGDALPLLAFTLNRMAADAGDGRLTHEAYDALGGVQGAIASRAAEVAHGGRTETQVAEAVLHLVNLGETKAYKRLARVADIPAAQREILDDLVDARLVVASEVGGHDVYAPAHEALFRAWPPLVDLIDDRRDDLRLRGRLERRAGDWRDAGATTSGLLTGLELDQARAWQSRNPDLGNADINAYLDASAKRRGRGLMLRASVAALVAALAVTLIVVLLVNSRAEQQRAVEARVGELVAIAERELVDDPAAAAVALLEGLEIDAEDADLNRVGRQLLNSPGRDVVRDEPGTSYVGLGGGAEVAAIGGTSGLIVWDTRTGTPLRTGQDATVVAMRSDDTTVATSDGVSLGLYDVSTETPALLADLGSHSPAVSFSPDGALLATVTGATIALWDMEDPSAPREIATTSPRAVVSALTVLDDGRVVFSDSSATLRVWDARGDGSTDDVIAAPPDAGLTTIDVDSAGERALLNTPTIGVSGIPVVDLETGELVSGVVAYDPPREATPSTITWNATMAPSGDRVAAFDLGGRGYVVDLEGGSLITDLMGHGAPVTGATFLGNGDLVTAGLDGTMRVWDTEAGAKQVQGPLDEALCDAFGARIDEDSWTRAMGESELDSPCD